MDIAHNDPAPKRRRGTPPPEPPPPPAQIDDIPQLAGWRWHSRLIGLDTFEHALIAPDGWETKRYQRPTKAIAEALRRVRSQPREQTMSRSPTAATPAALDAVRADIRHAIDGTGTGTPTYHLEQARAAVAALSATDRASVGRVLTQEIEAAAQGIAARALPDIPADLHGWAWELSDGQARLVQPVEGYQTTWGLIDATAEQPFAEARKRVAADLALAEAEPPIRKGPALRLSTGATVEIAIARLRRDGGTQPRAGIDRDHVARLEEALAAGEALPPVVVYYDGSDHWLADGYHRVEAHERRRLEAIAADVRQGTRRDAVLYSTGANRAHGLPRSRDDLRRAIETLLRDEEWGRWSDREIARQIGCSHATVGGVRRGLESTGQIDQSTTRTSGDGRERPASQPARRETFTADEIAASLRSALLRRDTHAAQPLLYGLPAGGLRGRWAHDLDRVEDVALWEGQGNADAARVYAERVRDAELREALLAQLAPTPATPATHDAAAYADLVARFDRCGAVLTCTAPGRPPYLLHIAGRARPVEVADWVGLEAQIAAAERAMAEAQAPAESPDAEIEALIADLETVEARVAEGCAGADDVAELKRISEQADRLLAVNIANRADQLIHQIGESLPAPAPSAPDYPAALAALDWSTVVPGQPTPLLIAEQIAVISGDASFPPDDLYRRAFDRAKALGWRLNRTLNALASQGGPPYSLSSPERVNERYDRWIDLLARLDELERPAAMAATPEQIVRNALMTLDTDTASRLAASDPALLAAWASDIQTTDEIAAARRDEESIDQLLARVRDGQLRTALAQLSPTGLAALDAALGEDGPTKPFPALVVAATPAPALDDATYATAEPILARVLARLSPLERAVLAAVTLTADDLDHGALDDPAEALWEHWTFVAGDRLAYLAEALEASAEAATPEPWPESDHPDLDALSSAAPGGSTDPARAGGVFS